jgi:hypothetical protein
MSTPPSADALETLKRTRHLAAVADNRVRSSICTRQMAFERLPSPIRFTVRIKMQHYSSNFTPVRTLCVRVEQTQILDDVFLVVEGQNGIGGCGRSGTRRLG